MKSLEHHIDLFRRQPTPFLMSDVRWLHTCSMKNRSSCDGPARTAYPTRDRAPRSSLQLRPAFCFDRYTTQWEIHATSTYRHTTRRGRGMRPSQVDADGLGLGLCQRGRGRGLSDSPDRPVPAEWHSGVPPSRTPLVRHTRSLP